MSSILKNKILASLRELIEKWLLGFNDSDFDVGIFSSEKLNIKNAIINVKEVNKLLYEYKMPFRLKAGIIGKLNVKSSVWNLFSESFKMELSDIHFIFGPNRDNMSRDDQFHQDPSTCEYDCEDQFTNIMLMSEIVHKIQSYERPKFREIRLQERLQRKKYRERIREEIRKKEEVQDYLEQQKVKQGAPKSQSKPEQEFKEPPLMGLLTRLFRGIKYDIKNIHIRYEDDFFVPQAPFSFGVTIRDIKLDTDEKSEEAERKVNPSTIVKLQQLRDMSCYWNSMSEMFIPTSVYEQSHDLQYGIFELISADTLLQMMQDIFSQKVGITNEYLVEPFTYQMQFSLRNTFDMRKDFYKYRMSIGIDKIICNLNPATIKDIMKFNQYLEGQSFLRELQRFRPIIRIQKFIDLRKKGTLTPALEKKRKAVIRDWFRLVLWFVRLRKAVKAFLNHYQNIKSFSILDDQWIYKNYPGVPHSLLEIEYRIQQAKGKNFELKNVKKARVEDYIELKDKVRKQAEVDDSDDMGVGYDSCSSDDVGQMMLRMERMDNQDEADESFSMTEIEDEQLLNKDEMQNQFLKMTTKMTSMKNLRLFLSGVQMHLEAKGFALNVYFPSKKITRNGMIVPNLYFEAERFAIIIEFINQQKKQNLGVIFRMFLKQMKMMENQIINSLQKMPNKILEDSFDGISSINIVNKSVSRLGKTKIPTPNHSFIGGNRIGASPDKKNRAGFFDVKEEQKKTMSNIQEILLDDCEENFDIDDDEPPSAIQINKGISQDQYPIMNNQLLQNHCNIFTSDSGFRVEQRCFLLFKGKIEDLHSNAFSVDIFFQNPDDPDHKQDAEIKIKIENMVCEHSQDIIIGLTRVVPDFSSLLRFNDIHHNPFGKSKNSQLKHNNTSLQRKVKLMVPFYHIKKTLLPNSIKNQRPVLQYQYNMIRQRIDEEMGLIKFDIPDEKANQQKFKENIAIAQQDIQILDNFLAGIDFKMQFEIDLMSFEFTGSKNQDKFGNKKLFNFGCESQKYTIQKSGDSIESKICGWTVGCHGSFEEHYKFLIKTNNEFKEIAKQMVEQFSEDTYVKMLLKEVAKTKHKVNQFQKK